MKAHALARLGRDSESRFTNSGQQVTSLSLAINYGRRGEDGKRPTQWVDGSLWGERGEKLAPYLLKGTLIVVSLSDVHIEEFEGKNGKASKLVARVDDLELVANGQRDQAQQSQAARPPAAAPRQASPSLAQRQAGGFEDMDDGVPF